MQKSKRDNGEKKERNLTTTDNIPKSNKSERKSFSFKFEEYIT